VREQWTSSKLDGDVYTQPLLVGSRVVIATEHDTVYPLNATDGAIVWQRHLGEPVAGSSLPCDNIDPVGITGTPVVDVPTNRIYVVAMVQSGQHMLFELDATTGRVIASTRVDANGVDPAVRNQRRALTLSNGTIFVPYGGRYGDCGDYHGGLVAVTVSVSGLGTVASYTLPTQRAASRGYSARLVRTFVRTLGTKRAPTRGRVCVFAGETWCRRNDNHLDPTRSRRGHVPRRRVAAGRRSWAVESVGFPGGDDPAFELGTGNGTVEGDEPGAGPPLRGHDRRIGRRSHPRTVICDTTRLCFEHNKESMMQLVQVPRVPVARWVVCDVQDTASFERSAELFRSVVCYITPDQLGASEMSGVAGS